VHKFVIHTPSWGDSCAPQKEAVAETRGHAFSTFAGLSIAKKDLEDAATKLVNDPFGLRTVQNQDGCKLFSPCSCFEIVFQRYQFPT
jgi:hypothetical protein